MMRRSLQDMVTVITGASSGIGRALAMDLAGRGGRLVLAARRRDRLEELARDLGGEHCCLAADVSRPEDCHRIIDAALEKFGRLDTIVCNAGYGFARPFDAMSEQDIRRIFDTNLFGTIECCRRAVVAMKGQEPRDAFRGQLMIVSSACARRGLPYFSTYAATKAAQLSLAEGLRIELKPYAIAVTSVHPVRCQTEFFSTANDLSGMDPAALAEGSKQSPGAVAARMVRAIESPRGEVWPKALSRLSLSIAVAIPAAVDKVMCGIRDRMLREHENKGKRGNNVKAVCDDSESSLEEVAHPAR
ncbi:MAG: SDR family NAD(P)-dependent oxidoreductase [Tepidisphaeraceae bacterium]